MEFFSENSALVSAVVDSGLLDAEPFVLIDVGCGGGIDAHWRVFGDRLIAYGFDPDVRDCEELERRETNPRIRYVPSFVGLPSSHPFVSSRPGGTLCGNNPWDRLSTPAAIENRRRLAKHELSHREKRSLNLWRECALADESSCIVLPEFLTRHEVDYVDFVKIDVDGRDFEVLVSLADVLTDLSILGIGMEVQFFGSANPTDHTFHNTDRFLKSYGFELFDLSTRHYSTAALPTSFVYSVPVQTIRGRIYQGDALYLRDVVNPTVTSFIAMTPVRLLKLCCLFEMLGLADCAAEVLLTYRPQIESVGVRVDSFLDMLVPRPRTGWISYPEYIERFENDDLMFYPVSSRRATTGQRLRRVLARRSPRGLRYLRRLAKTLRSFGLIIRRQSTAFVRHEGGHRV